MATAVGDFIRYWGFRRIHGQIWTELYLSKQTLSGKELTRRLGVSKALVSPALHELIEFKLIRQTQSTGKLKQYCADPNVFQVIVGVLNNRERHLIENAQKTHRILTESLKTQDILSDAIDLSRLTELGEMIKTALSALLFVVNHFKNDGFLDLSSLEELGKK